MECSNGLEGWEGQAGPQRYSFAAREIGDALASVAAGASYKQAAESARRQADRMRPARPRKRTGARKRTRRRREAVRDGQLAANWVDAFADEIADELLPSGWPEIVIIDSMSVRVLSGPRKRKSFHVIAAVGRDRSLGRWSAPFHVVRVATSTTKEADAFEGFCRGLEGIPRVVVCADMDSGTRLGISRAFTVADGSLPEMRMGEWHLKRALRGNLPDELLADPHNRVTQQLASTFISPRKWRDFLPAVRFEHESPYGPLPGALDFIDRNDAQIRAQAATRRPASARRPKKTSSLTN